MTNRMAASGAERQPRFLEWMAWLLLVTVGFPLSFGAAESVDPTSPAGSLPSASEVIQRFIKTVGGKAAFDKIDSQHMTGKFEMAAQGLKGDLEIFAKRPDKLLIKMTVPGLGDLVQGFDGKVGWTLNPMTGPMVLEGKMLEQAHDQARFDAVMHNADEFKTMETVARTSFEGQDAFKLKLVRKTGQEVTEYYDTQTGLLLGSSEVEETPLGAIAVSALVGDYRKFGDVLFAMKMTQKMGPLAQVMTFEKMEFNAVNDSVFALPPQIKGLVK